MSRRLGRPQRPVRLRVRTVRREPIDYDALARAALEHAAMNYADEAATAPPHRERRQHPNEHKPSKERRHDDLA